MVNRTPTPRPSLHENLHRENHSINLILIKGFYRKLMYFNQEAICIKVFTFMVADRLEATLIERSSLMFGKTALIARKITGASRHCFSIMGHKGPPAVILIAGQQPEQLERLPSKGRAARRPATNAGHR
jgi:hypothetical protein